MHYVTLSHAKSLQGLHILKLQEDRISINKEVEQEMQHLRTCATDCFHPFNQPSNYKILFLNSNSLNCHLVDVRADYRLYSSDILAFCETRFNSSDNKQATGIDGYHTYRQDLKAPQRNIRPLYGIAISRLPFLQDSPLNRISHRIEVSIMNIQHEIP